MGPMTTHSDDLAPARDWFARHSWEPFSFQLDIWRAYLAGESGLTHAATGTGKTYAAWFGPLLQWLAANPDRTRWPAQPPRLRVLWITPLRALAADTEQALRTPLVDLGLPWTVERRTGDVSSHAKGRQLKKPPTALITTPESLSLLLSQPDARAFFADLEAVIVDEWHELMATKRGVQTELALARLRRWQPGLRTWGLSATIGNLDVALRTLIGTADYATGEISRGQLVQGDMTKQLYFESIIPPTVERFPWAGHLGLKLLPQVIEQIERTAPRSSLPTRATKPNAGIRRSLAQKDEWAGDIALHHSSLDPATRTWVENELRKGRLRCVVCTSSLDLGVDFPAVDCVLQVGSPKGVARLMQRAGRSGHQPGATSRVVCVPTHALELLEVSAARMAMQEGHIEERQPVAKPLDVLVQHLVTIGLGGGFVAGGTVSTRCARPTATDHARR